MASRKPQVEASLIAVDQTDAPPHLFLIVDDVKPIDPRRPCGRKEKGAEHLDQTGLSRAVPPEKSENLASLDPEGEAVARLFFLDGRRPAEKTLLPVTFSQFNRFNS